jgi:DNA-binding response OmpR family regulator
MFTVAVVDDEKNIRNIIGMALREDGFVIKEFSNGEAAWTDFQVDPPDVIVLDIMMPRMNGLELCKRIRVIDQSVPIIFLSSRDDEFDKVLGLESGADDYVCKPFSIMELTARIRAAARRCSGSSSVYRSDYDIETGSLQMCSAELITMWKQQPVKLSVTEYRILGSLAGVPGTVKTREQLMSAAFPEDSYINDRAADSHIKRIRKKIKEVDPDAEVFDAVYGLGYRLRIDE